MAQKEKIFEALEWIKDEDHEFYPEVYDKESAIDFFKHLYEMGAEKVYVVADDGESVWTSVIKLKVPNDKVEDVLKGIIQCGANPAELADEKHKDYQYLTIWLDF